MLYGSYGFRIARMKIQVAVTNRKNCTAAAADQTAQPAEQMFGMV